MHCEVQACKTNIGAIGAPAAKRRASENGTCGVYQDVSRVFVLCNGFLVAPHGF